MIAIRPATAEDIARFSDMANKPSIRAWVAEQDGRLLGMGGIALAKGRWFGFVDVTDEMLAHKITLARAAIRFLDEVKRSGVRFIYAEVSPHEPGAGRWLESLGFEFDVRSQHFYRWSAKEC